MVLRLAVVAAVAAVMALFAVPARAESGLAIMIDDPFQSSARHV